MEGDTMIETIIQPEAGKKLPNGATCIAVYADDKFGIVLAVTQQQSGVFVTWHYNVEQGAKSTAMGSYQVAGDWNKAKEDFRQRVKQEMRRL